VLIEGYRVRGVLLDSGETVGCDNVISSADPASTFLDLVDAAWFDPDLRHAVANIKMRGCSGYVCYGTAELSPALATAKEQDALKAVISLTSSLDGIERAYDAVKYGAVAPNPHVEIAIPTARWPALAPAGQHVIMARAHYVPHGIARDTMASRVDGAVEAAFPGFLSRVLHRVALAPADVAERYAVREGSLSHGELTLDQVLFMRPLPALSQYFTPIDGLLLGGSGCHPGPGAEGSAGVLAAKALLRRQRGKKE
jgi:phytoene dehydrogenase-like protein